jgi:type II restriction enzyme
MALEKNRRAIPFIEEGRALKAAASKAKKASDLLGMAEFWPALLTASGLSAKALNHLEESDKTDAIRGLVEQFLEPAGDNFVDELICRFLLIKGDSLGGAMRNIAGFLAEQLFKRSIISALRVRNLSFLLESKKAQKWIKGEFPIDYTDDVNGIYWKSKSDRVLIFNKTIPFIKKNIDVCLLSSNPQNVLLNIKTPTKYIALGELKGGIDPAGADEHWKTARTAIERIIHGFEKEGVSVQTVFIGAAIEKAMSEEIWSWLQSGKLSNAGNLTNKDHVASVSDWLVRL